MLPCESCQTSKAMMSVSGNLTNAETLDTLNWSFDSGTEAFDYLADGEALVLTYTIEVTDSSAATDTQTVVITINGTNDAPAISIVDVDGSITEEGSVSDSGSISFTDLDLSEEAREENGREEGSLTHRRKRATGGPEIKRSVSKGIA